MERTDVLQEPINIIRKPYVRDGWTTAHADAALNQINVCSNENRTLPGLREIGELEFVRAITGQGLIYVRHAYILLFGRSVNTLCFVRFAGDGVLVGEVPVDMGISTVKHFAFGCQHNWHREGKETVCCYCNCRFEADSSD